MASVTERLVLCVVEHAGPNPREGWQGRALCEGLEVGEWIEGRTSSDQFGRSDHICFHEEGFKVAQTEDRAVGCGLSHAGSGKPPVSEV